MSEKKNIATDPVPGFLYVVATPIGNLEDITFRAVQILRGVSLIAAEDTRHTRKLLARFDIHTPLVSCFKETELARSTEIIERLQSGQDIALVSDAGTPGISDPGALLVAHARNNDICVVPVPGPSALTAALSVAGISSAPFLFLGFLPSPAARRRKVLKKYASFDGHIVFYEAPHRICATVRDCAAVFGNRNAVLCRELTKRNEEVLSASLDGLALELSDRQRIKGEFVMIVEGMSSPKASPPVEGDVEEILGWYRDNSSLSMKDAVREISATLGLPRSTVYREALEVWKEKA